MENPLERLTWVRDRVSLNSKSFAESIGMTAAALHNMYTRKSRVTPVLANSVELVHGVRAEWLLTGEGDREVPRHAGLSPLERCGLETLFFGRHFWGYLEPLVFERLQGRIHDRFGSRLRECDIVKPNSLTTKVDERQLAGVVKIRDSELAETEKIRKVFKNLRKEEKTCVENRDIPGQQKKVRLGYALLLAVHFGDEWESIKEDSLEWSAVVKDGTVEEFDKLHFQINEIRSEIDL